MAIDAINQPEMLLDPMRDFSLLVDGAGQWSTQRAWFLGGELNVVQHTNKSPNYALFAHIPIRTMS